MTTFLVGVLGFTSVISILVILLIFARHILVGSGTAIISFGQNKRSKLKVETGDNLQQLLSRSGIPIASACGGKGTCGTCMVVVHSGGGGISPIEQSIIPPADLKKGVRLACQLKVKQDLEIELPEELNFVKQFECQVRSNNQIASFIKELVLDLPSDKEFVFRAGDYVLLESPAYQLNYSDIDVLPVFQQRWRTDKLFEYQVSSNTKVHRSYSLANYPGEKGILKFNIRLATPPAEHPEVPPGIVSSFLFNLKPKDSVLVTGPYGEMHAKSSPAEMIFIGGGVGMAPLRSLIYDQLLNKQSKNKISFWYGARSFCESIYKNEFDTLAKDYANFDWTLALSVPQIEDHWKGATGFIHQVVFDQYLSSHPAPEDIDYYLCGPPKMIEACLKMLDELGVDEDNILVDQFG